MNVLVDKQKIDILANAISNKSGEPVTMTLDEMVEAVDGIQTGSGEPNLQAKTYTVSSAGTSAVTADSGYDGLSEVEVSVPYGGIMQAETFDFEPAVSVSNSGLVTVSGNDTKTLFPVTESGWLDAEENGVTVYVNVYGSQQLSTQGAITITPTTSSQTAVTAGKYTTGAVTVGAIPSQYIVPSGTYTVDSAGTKDVTQYASASVPSGTAGTPSATKGAVSNHSVTVTPSVTNSTGWITGSTKTGTAVSVSASELVSGTYTVTSSGTKDVTNYASASIASGTEGTPSATKGTVSNHSVIVTPSVTNSAGWISGSTKTGTAVTVSASELVSGTYNITTSGTHNVTNYASASVTFSTIYSGSTDPSSSTGANGDIYIKVVS